MSLKLALECARGNYKSSTKKINGVTSDIYEVETDTDILYFWNSTNSSSFDEEDVLHSISEEIENENYNGSVSYDFNEIMFETHEK